MSNMSRALLAALLIATTPASAGTIYVNDSTVTITSISNIVVGAKYRLAPTNFDQSLDSGGGTNLVGGQPNFLSANLGNLGALNGATYDFTFEHRAGQGFIFTMVSQGGVSNTQAWGTFMPAVTAQQSATVLPALAATGQVPGTLIAPGLAFNALHLEARATVNGTTNPSVTYANLTFLTPGLTQVGSLVTGFTTVPGNNGGNVNFPDGNDFHSQWFVADTNLALFDWTLAGKVRFDVMGSGALDERVRFGITGKQVAFTGGVIPEPTTWAMLIAGFGLVGAAMRRRRDAALSA